MGSTAWPTVTRWKPCVICGKPDWCCRSTDGCWAICRRVNNSEGLHRTDKAGADYWLYSLTDARPGRPAIEIPARPSPERTSPDVLHRVHRTLLDKLPLTQIHRDNLRSRGLTDDEIARRQYRTIPLHGRARLAQGLVERFGPDLCAKVPGVCIRTEGGRHWWTLAGASGIAVPVRDLHGRIVSLVVRSDTPDADPKYSAISSTRYGGPSSGVHVHVPLFPQNSCECVRVTEGALKSDIATSLTGMLTVGLPGVLSWRRVTPLLHDLKARVVVMAFDADAHRNFFVARAQQQAARALRDQGLVVMLERWQEESGKGVDDLIARGGAPELLEGKNMWEAMREDLRSASLLDPVQIRQRERRAVEINVARSTQPTPDDSDPWAGRITLPLRPYRGYAGYRPRRMGGNSHG